MKQKSVTLVEIIVSMVILSLVLSGIAGIFLAGKRYLKRAEFKQAALNFAREKLEELEACDFDNTDPSLGCVLQSGSDTLPNGWTRRWTIDNEDYDNEDLDNDDDTGTDYKHITITVQWQEPLP